MYPAGCVWVAKTESPAAPVVAAAVAGVVAAAVAVADIGDTAADADNIAVAAGDNNIPAGSAVAAEDNNNPEPAPTPKLPVKPTRFLNYKTVCWQGEENCWTSS